MVARDLVQALTDFRKVQIQMPDTDTLSDGRDLVIKLQMECNFPLVYVQRLGCDPVVIVWRLRDTSHAMEGYRVERYQC